MITNDQWEAMKREAKAGECDEPTKPAEPRKWFHGWALGGGVGMLSRWTGEQGTKDMSIPMWKKVYARIFLRGEF